MNLRYLLDEQLRGQLWQAIRWHNRASLPLDVLRVGDPPDLPRVPGPDILVWAEREGRILISADRRTLLGHLAAHQNAGHHSPGLFLLRPLAPLPQVVDFLVAAAYASERASGRTAGAYIP